ncbi:hypothetical protein XMM312_000412 [Marinobacterium sp. xm-m-312]|nr:hypothetical protein [Marinobacterium sp. xm-m-312]
MSIYEQLAQQPDPESIAPEQRTGCLIDLLAMSADKPESRLLLGYAHECEQEQSISLLIKGG